MPQHHLEPILHRGLNERHPGCVHLRHKLVVVRKPRRWRRRDLRDAGWPARGRRLLSARLRRRTQHHPLAAWHCGRRRVAERADAAGRREGRSRCAEPARLSLSRLFRRSDRMDDPGSPAALLALPVSACRRPAGADARAIPREDPALHRPGAGHGDHQHHRLSHPSPDRDRMAARPRLPDGRRRASDHADVGARTEYRHSRRHQPALAAGLGGARLGRSGLARRLCARAASGRGDGFGRDGGSRPQIHARPERRGAGDVRRRAGQCDDPHHARRAARRRPVRRLVDGAHRARPAARRRARARHGAACTATAGRCGCTI